jgi:hypothetical protein
MAFGQSWEERVSTGLATTGSFCAIDEFSCEDIYSVCPTDNGWSIVSFLGGPCGGATICCYPDGIDPPPTCNRSFYLQVELADGSFELDFLSRNSYSYTILPYPPEIENIQLQETEVHVPLGRAFKVKYKADVISGGEEECIRDTAEPVESTYTISEAVNGLSFFNPSDPLDLKYVLFKDDVVVPLGGTDNTEEVEFMPVHLGTTKIKLRWTPSLNHSHLKTII